MPEIIQKELSYKIIGILFEIHTGLGNHLQEKIYQKAIEEAFKLNKINFKRELKVDLIYKQKKIGYYYLDFLIEKCLVLEIKTVDSLKPADFNQVLSYLKANNIQIGILANFRSNRLLYKRILNSKYSPT